MISRRGFAAALFVFFGILVLLAITYIVPILFHETHKEPAVRQATPAPVSTKKADIVIKPFKRTITDQGKMEMEIHASEAQINQQDKMFLLTDIRRVVFYGKDNRKYSVKADRGNWDQKNKKVFINGHVRSRIEEEGKPPVTIQSDWLSYDSSRKSLTGGGDVVIEYGSYHTTADKISVVMDKNIIVLDGNVVSRISPKAFEKTAFSLKTPVVITAASLTYNHQSSRLEYHGNAKIAGGKNSVQAESITYEFDSGQRFILRDRVYLSVILSPDASGPQLPMRLRCAEMVVDLNAGEILLRRKIRVRYRGSKLSAHEIRFQISSDSKDIISASAYGNLVYVQGGTNIYASSGFLNPLE